MFTSPRKMIGTAFKLFALCVVVGIVMAILGINDPLQVWGNFLRWMKDIWNNYGRLVEMVVGVCCPWCRNRSASLSSYALPGA